MDTITIEGPHGRFEVCANTGQMVTPYSKIPKQYREYSAANVSEYKAWCDRQGLPHSPAHLLNIGMYMHGGRKLPPVEEFREEWLIERQFAHKKVA